MRLFPSSFVYICMYVYKQEIWFSRGDTCCVQSKNTQNHDRKSKQIKILCVCLTLFIYTYKYIYFCAFDVVAVCVSCSTCDVPFVKHLGA